MAAGDPDKKGFDNLEDEYQSSSSRMGALVWAIIGLLIAGLAVALVARSFSGDPAAVAKKMRLKQALNRFGAEPTNPAYAKEAAEAWEASGKPTEAEKIRAHHTAAIASRDEKREQSLRTRLKDNPKDSEALGLLLEFLAERGKSDEARSLYSASVAADPQPKRRAAYGTWLWRNKFTSEAVAELTRALKEGYDTPETHGYLGFALLDQGKKKEAFPELQRALKGNADIGPLRARYLELAKELGVPLE
ncbi:MAG TPA: tetratricopeptide repeat protein [Myxococcales bacterium]|jgi:predicted Zn-dependent protease